MIFYSGPKLTLEFDLDVRGSFGKLQGIICDRGPRGFLHPKKG